MKKLLIFTIFSTLLFAKTNIIVSIPPQKTFVEKIGGDKVSVKNMVKQGQDPHTYEPKPSQMKDISKADIYFSIGVEFEHAWLPKFKTANNSMKVIASDRGINKIEIQCSGHDHSNHNHNEEALDPHTWLAPSSVKVIAKNIYNALKEIDPTNKAFYKKNYENFLNEINDVDNRINDILLTVEDKARFVVFHPSWGYFAKDYRLTQIAIEQSGKSPKPKHLIKIIKQINSSYIEVIITAPEFNQSAAEQIAKQTGVKVIHISPLNENWSQTLISLAKAIANK